MRRVVLLLALASPMAPGGRPATAGESWVLEYPRVAEAAERSCAGPDLPRCRQQLLRLAQLLDGRVDIVYRLAKVEAGLGHDAESLDYLDLYSRSQLDFGDPAREIAFRKLRETPRWQSIERRYRRGLEPRGEYRMLLELPAPDLVAEDLVYDPRSGAHFVSSVHRNKVLRLDAGGAWSDFLGAADLAAWGIYALAVDPARDRLWVGSAAGPVSPPFRSEDHGRSQVLRVGMRSREVERRYELADGAAHAFADFALGAGGVLYVSDGVGGGVYRIGPEPDAALAPLVSPGQLRSPQTAVPLPDGTLLIPDYSRGIARSDLAHPGRVSWLPHPPELALYGIDGMYLRGRTLIAIQNGTVPERLLLLRLDTSFARIVGWTVALARIPGLGDPTHGVVRGDRFEFISNSGWDRMDDDGTFKAGSAAAPPALWAISLPQ